MLFVGELSGALMENLAVAATWELVAKHKKSLILQVLKLYKMPHLRQRRNYSYEIQRMVEYLVRKLC